MNTLSEFLSAFWQAFRHIYSGVENQYSQLHYYEIKNKQNSYQAYVVIFHAQWQEVTSLVWWRLGISPCIESNDLTSVIYSVVHPSVCVPWTLMTRVSALFSDGHLQRRCDDICMPFCARSTASRHARLFLSARQKPILQRLTSSFTL